MKVLYCIRYIKKAVSLRPDPTISRVTSHSVVVIWSLGRGLYTIYNKEKRSLGFGVQSIKHANVLSEKINFSALGGSKVAIFGGDDLDPIYFEVHMFLNPPGPPYMSKNAKMCYF